MNADTKAPAALLERVRKLLAKADAEGVTKAEAEALTEKAAELMARYGIDRALLAATNPQTDRASNKTVTIGDPWASLKVHLLSALGTPLRCQGVQLPARGDGQLRVHMFGYLSDLERLEVLYTSLLLQMAHGLRRARVPSNVRSVRAWRRSWMLGFITDVTERVRVAEAKATQAASDEHRTAGGKSAALVLADRDDVVARQLKEAYPRTRKMRITYTGSGYAAGREAGSRADIGGARVGRRTAGAIGR